MNFLLSLVIHIIFLILLFFNFSDIAKVQLKDEKAIAVEIVTEAPAPVALPTPEIVEPVAKKPEKKKMQPVVKKEVHKKEIPIKKIPQKKEEIKKEMPKKEAAAEAPPPQKIIDAVKKLTDDHRRNEAESVVHAKIERCWTHELMANPINKKLDFRVLIKLNAKASINGIVVLDKERYKGDVDFLYASQAALKAIKNCPGLDGKLKKLANPTMSQLKEIELTFSTEQ